MRENKYNKIQLINMTRLFHVTLPKKSRTDLKFSMKELIKSRKLRLVYWFINMRCSKCWSMKILMI